MENPLPSGRGAFNASRPVMGPHRNRPLTTAAAAVVAVVIVTLNLALLGLTLIG
ncbi:hypothetical protein [Streptomyces sp. CA-106131]|uniref:hypothetical protein n=1 Tax=Streptomyces sp. CA-106131 TaxID=3240045 RepID=UPI003D8A0393